jgi:predicted DNA-binding transcriptional regulator AlpA
MQAEETVTRPRVILIDENGDVIRSVAEFAKRANLSQRQVRYMIADGTSPRVIQLTKQRIGFREKDIGAWLDARERTGVERKDVLSAAEDNSLRNIESMLRGDPRAVTRLLNDSAVPMRANYAALLDIAVYLFRLSPDPEAGLAALRERVTATGTD